MSASPKDWRRIEHQWLRALAGEDVMDVRAVVRDSWERSRMAGVCPDMPRAPVALDDSGLAVAREQTDWLLITRQTIGILPGSFSGPGHVLSFFGAGGRMLLSEGDPRTQEALAEINFAPGGLWLEDAAGTNGPGTALASDAPVHIIGPDHYCEAWQPWHCAAVPIHDQVTGEVLGALDISGSAERAHPHTLNLIIALALAVERSLAGREVERRYSILRAFAELTARYPNEVLVAADRAGRVLYASPAAPPEFHPGRPTPGPIRTALATLLREGASERPRDVQPLLRADEGVTAVTFPVYDEGMWIGGCILLQRPSRGRPDQRASRRQTRYSFLDLVGQSPALAEACRIAGAAAANTLPVLILGEAGVGKEVFAQSIHSASARRDRPFVAVNCAGLPAGLLESELFGYIGGAFSGARREGSPGKFEAAGGGTIFLDEIGELPATAQAVLLRVLQEGEVTRIGSTQSRSVDVRVIAATNRDLGVALEQGTFRRDLYDRLNVLTIELPPLRRRREDIPLLVQRFLDTACAETRRQGIRMDPEVVAALQAYNWPGNVRELMNVIYRLVALASSSRITLADLPEPIRRASRSALPPPEHEVGRPTVSDRGPDASAAESDPELGRLLGAINSARTMADAAALLGVTRSTLYRRLERYGLQPKRIFREK